MKKNTEKKSAEIKVTRAKEFKDGGVVFDVTINDVNIYGCRVVEGKDGDFVSFPSRKGSDDKYYNHAWYKLSKEETEDIISQVEKLI